MSQELFDLVVLIVASVPMTIGGVLGLILSMIPMIQRLWYLVIILGYAFCIWFQPFASWLQFRAFDFAGPSGAKLLASSVIVFFGAIIVVFSFEIWKLRRKKRLGIT